MGCKWTAALGDRNYFWSAIFLLCCVFLLSLKRVQGINVKRPSPLLLLFPLSSTKNIKLNISKQTKLDCSWFVEVNASSQLTDALIKLLAQVFSCSQELWTLLYLPEIINCTFLLSKGLWIELNDSQGFNL